MAKGCPIGGRMLLGASLALLLASCATAPVIEPSATGAKFDAVQAKRAAGSFDARIIRDRFGVPHIYGKRNADVAYGLAYAHAEDDWKHIEEAVRSNRGQLAEIQGPLAIVADQLMHALGNIEAVEQGYATGVSRQAKAIASAYAAGINLWCADHPESGCARTAPVRPQDIVAGYANRPPFFYGMGDELNKLLTGSGPVELSIRQAQSALLGADPDIELGSNALAVAPSRSADGHTRLAVNSHQPFTGTVAWYEARLKSEEGMDLIGGVFPGSPLILHGAGPKLGWAATVNRPDVFDFFKLVVDDEKNPTKYRMDGDWKDLARREVEIRVKQADGSLTPEVRTIYRSEHGPAFTTPRGVFAVSYAGDGQMRYLDQYLAMGTARTVVDWRKAQTTFNAIPSINYVVADSKGSIAYFWNANMPKRVEGWDRRKVLPGDISETLWQGFEPVERLPAVINPKSGYVVNANHTPYEASGPEDNPKPENYPASFGVDPQHTNRGYRAQVLFGGDSSITREEFYAYKMDDAYDPRSNVRKMVTALLARGPGEDVELKEAYAVLAAWDGTADRADRQAALAILTGQRSMGGQIHDAFDHDKTVAALKAVAAELKSAYGRLDPEWGEVSRIKRGDQTWPTDGGPDTLRAIYAGGNLVADKHLSGRAGDTYIAMADWGTDGAFRIETIHQFGSATVEPASPHFADQAPLFAAKQFRQPPMELADLLKEATRDYRPGRQ